MTQAYIITEGIADREILQAFLSSEINSVVEFVVGSGRYSAHSLARTLLATKQIPVVLMLDADTVAQTTILEQQDLLRSSLRQVASGTRFEVLLAIPEIEILLVQDIDYIMRLANRKPWSDLERKLAELQPKNFLRTILGDKVDYRKILYGMDIPTKEHIEQHPLLQDLNRFLSSVIDMELISQYQLVM